MSRARLIKPTFFTNETLAELPPYARLLFIGLWTLADREGLLEDRPKRIKAEVFPYETISVEPLLRRLHEAGFIVRYQSEGMSVIAIPSFLRHQKPHQREAASELPKADLGRASGEPSHDLGAEEFRLGTKEALPSPAVVVTGNRLLDPVVVPPEPLDSDESPAQGGLLDLAFGSVMTALSEVRVGLSERIAEQVKDRLDRGIPSAWLIEAIGLAQGKDLPWDYARGTVDRWVSEGKPKAKLPTEKPWGMRGLSLDDPNYVGPDLATIEALVAAGEL